MAGTLRLGQCRAVGGGPPRAQLCCQTPWHPLSHRPPRRKLAALKREGREAPTSVDEMERMLGTWRQYKSTNEGLDGGGGGAAVPLGHVGAHGQPCPLAGSPVGKNTK